MNSAIAVSTAHQEIGAQLLQLIEQGEIVDIIIRTTSGTRHGRLITEYCNITMSGNDVEEIKVWITDSRGSSDVSFWHADPEQNSSSLAILEITIPEPAVES